MTWGAMTWIAVLQVLAVVLTAVAGFVAHAERRRRQIAYTESIFHKDELRAREKEQAAAHAEHMRRAVESADQIGLYDVAPELAFWSCGTLSEWNVRQILWKAWERLEVPTEERVWLGPY